MHLRWLHHQLLCARPPSGLFCQPALRRHLAIIVPVVLCRRPELMPAGDALKALLLLEDSSQLVTALVCSLPGVWSDLKDVLVASVGTAASHARAVAAALWIVSAMGPIVALELRDALQGVPFGCHLAMQLTLAYDEHPIQWAASQAFGSNAHRKWLLDALSLPSSVPSLVGVSNDFRRRLWHTGRGGAPASMLALHLATMLVVGGLRPSAEDAALWVASLAALPPELPITHNDLMLCFMLLLLLLRSELPLDVDDLRAALRSLLDLSPASRRPMAAAVWLMMQLHGRGWGALAAGLRAAAAVKVAFPETAFTALASAAADAGLLQLEVAATFVSSAIQRRDDSAEPLLLESWEALLRAGHCHVESPLAFLVWASKAGSTPPPPLVRLASALAACAPKGALLSEAELQRACSCRAVQQISASESPGSALAPLVAFYAMEVEAAFRKSGGSQDESVAAAAQSWHVMLHRLPFREITTCMLAARPRERFSGFLPSWMALVTALLPSQVDVLGGGFGDRNGSFTLGTCHWEARLQLEVARESGGGPVELAEAAKGLHSACSDPLSCTQLLERLMLRSTRGGVAELSAVAEVVLRVLAPQFCTAEAVPLAVEKSFVRWWLSLPWTVQRPLLPHLVDVLSGMEAGHDGKGGEDAEARFRLAPAEMLRIAAATWRRPALVGMLLAQLVASLGECRTEAQLLTDQAAPDALATDELESALLVQDSVVVQILLEAVQVLSSVGGGEAEEGGDDMTDTDEGGVAEEVLSLLFDTIHILFLKQPPLVKLVHFQGYPSKLLPLMVDAIPSMEMCVEFLEELLQSEERCVGLFGCQLTGQLSTKYRQPRVGAAARRALYRCQGAASAGNLSFVAQSLSALGQLACAFPALCKDVVLLLQACVECGGREWQGESQRVQGAQPMLAEEAVRAFGFLIDNLLLHGSASSTIDCVPLGTQ